MGERTPTRRLEAALGNKVAVRHKPHGVLAVLGPYNFPAHLPNGHIVPALLAGNAVVFKPSEKTPATGAMLVDCFHEAGVPAGVLRLLVGGPDQGRALAKEEGIDGLLFTGSARAGMSLHRQFAETPHKILALELGGNNPIVVWGAKDLPAAAAIVVQSAFLSAGQRCTAARRLIVEDGQHEPLIAEVVKLIDRIIVDHPHADPQPFMGPVIDDMAAEILQDQWVGLMMKGGKPIRRLERPHEDRPYLTPALIDVTDAKDRPDAELFGPVLQLIRVKDFDAAIAEANNTRFGLAASLLVARSRALSPLLGRGPRRGDQLEPPDQRRAVQRPVRRSRDERQPPPERLLCRRLLRLSRSPASRPTRFAPRSRGIARRLRARGRPGRRPLTMAAALAMGRNER